MSRRVTFLSKIAGITGLLVLTAAFFTLPVQSLFAQSEEELKKELEKTEAEIAEEQRKLEAQKRQSNLIQTEVNKLTTQINTAQKNIDAKASAIKEIGKDISIKDQTVSQLNNKLDRSTDILADIVRTKNQVDDISLVEIMLAYDNLSDFYKGVDSILSVQNSVDNLLDDIRELRGLTEEEKVKLAEKQAREQDQKAKIELEKSSVVVKQNEQKGILASSKATEAAHEAVLAEKRAKANSIRTALFRLRDTGNITFEQAQAFAEAASRATGVRTAFILGILKQETNIGQYLGSCVITDLNTGSTRHVSNGTVFADGIHPTRDLPVLQSVLTRLGRDPLETKISCPIVVGKQIVDGQEIPVTSGYGGAMGPSQFIPSTWRLYENRIAQTLGVSIADPWSAEHAIMGTALLLKDNGAISGSYESERNAACRYYSGRSCDASLSIASYGNNVMSHTSGFQANIDFLADVDSED